jgi:hypothetical protein
VYISRLGDVINVSQGWEQAKANFFLAEMWKDEIVIVTVTVEPLIVMA